MRLAIAPIAVFFVVSPVVADGAAEIEDAIAHHAQIAVVARRNLQPDQPILDAIEIDLDHDWLLGLRILSLAFLFVLGLRLLFVGFLRVGFLFFFLLLFLGLPYFVAPRSKGILRILGQRHQINARHVAIDLGEILLAEDRLKVAARGQEEIFSVIAKRRIGRRIPVVGHGNRLLLGQRVKVDFGRVVLFRARPGNPLAVRRPIVALDFADWILIDLRDRLARDIDVSAAVAGDRSRAASCCRATKSACSSRYRRCS